MLWETEEEFSILPPLHGVYVSCFSWEGWNEGENKQTYADLGGMSWL